MDRRRSHAGPSAPSGSQGRRSRSEWPTSSTTSNACCSFGRSRSHKAIGRQKRPSLGDDRFKATKISCRSDRNALVARKIAVNRSAQLITLSYQTENKMVPEKAGRANDKNSPCQYPLPSNKPYQILYDIIVTEFVARSQQYRCSTECRYTALPR